MICFSFVINSLFMLMLMNILKFFLVVQSGLRSRIMKLKNRAEEIFRDGDLIFTSERNLGARNVQMDYDIVRANQPAVVQTGCRWIIGDVTEVLDRNTWKLGKIAKMLKNNYFVIRLADCIQLKEFHISSLRVPASPHSNNQYSVVDKVTSVPQACVGALHCDFFKPIIAQLLFLVFICSYLFHEC